MLLFFFNCITAPYFWNLSILFHVQYLALKCFCIVSPPDSSSSFLRLTLCNQKRNEASYITPLLTLQLIDFSLYLFTSCVCLFFLINCKIKLFLCSKKQNNTYPFQIKRLQKRKQQKKVLHSRVLHLLCLTLPHKIHCILQHIRQVVS